jgi:ABC-2 type transport system ATP-binding protein
VRSRGDYGSRKVIALGTPQQLIATVGGEDIVEFAVRFPGPRIPSAANIHTRSGCGGADGDSGRAVASRGCGAAPAFGERAALAVPRIFAALKEQGLHLSEFRTHSATLEDVFVRLTGRNLRDE